MLEAISDTSQDLALNGHWVIEVLVVDDDGDLVDSVPVITVTSPTAVVTTPTVETVRTGIYRATVTTSTAGRYTATAVATSYGAAAFSAYVTDVSAAAAFPTLAQVKTYLGITGSGMDTTVQDALDAETAAQRRVCEVGPFYTADLAQALKRRVARNLALRGIPLAVLQGDAESGNLRLPGSDPEVRRLERPYRKLVQP